MRIDCFNHYTPKQAKPRKDLVLSRIRYYRIAYRSSSYADSQHIDKYNTELMECHIASTAFTDKELEHCLSVADDLLPEVLRDDAWIEVTADSLEFDDA